MLKKTITKRKAALVGVALWVEHGPVNQTVTGDSQSGHLPGLQTRPPV